MLACVCCLTAYDAGAYVTGAAAAALHVVPAAAAAVNLVVAVVADYLMLAVAAAAEWPPAWAGRSSVTLVASQVNQCWAFDAVPWLGQISQQVAGWRYLWAGSLLC